MHSRDAVSRRHGLCARADVCMFSVLYSNRDGYFIITGMGIIIIILRDVSGDQEGGELLCKYLPRMGTHLNIYNDMYIAILYC